MTTPEIQSSNQGWVTGQVGRESLNVGISDC